MEDLNRSVVTLLALINPVICAVMLQERTSGVPPLRRRRLGISLDVFQIVGGVVITTIGCGMFVLTNLRTFFHTAG